MKYAGLRRMAGVDRRKAAAAVFRFTGGKKRVSWRCDTSRALCATGICPRAQEEITIETRQLNVFVTVYRSGSFTRAAEQLSTSQPAVSEQIRSLERRLGCRLFDRLGRSIKPTRQAEILFPKALAILEDIRRLEQELLREDNTVSGELILGASTIPGAYLLPRIATDFKALHPEISFEIRIADSGEIIDSVMNHDLLVGLVGSRAASRNLNFFPLVEDELVLAVSANRETENPVSLDELARLPFLLREQGSGTRKTLEEYSLRNGFDLGRLNTVAVLGSNAAIKQAIKEDLGVSILSRISIRDDLDCGRLKEISIRGVTLKRSFYVVTLKKRTLPHHYAVFLDTLRKREG